MCQGHVLPRRPRPLPPPGLPRAHRSGSCGSKTGSRPSSRPWTGAPTDTTQPDGPWIGRRRPVRRSECQRVDREKDIRPVVGVEVRQPRAGEVTERAMAKETPERSAPCAYPEPEPARFEQVSGARAIGARDSRPTNPESRGARRILVAHRARFDQVLEVVVHQQIAVAAAMVGQRSEPDRETLGRRYRPTRARARAEPRDVCGFVSGSTRHLPSTRRR